MSSAWGSSWGSAWGNSWGSTAAAVEVVIDVDGLRRRDRDAEIFLERQKASREALRAAIERAFEGPKPDTLPERQEVARQVLSDISFDGLTSSLGRIERLIAEYEQEMAEEEAVELLLLAN